MDFERLCTGFRETKKTEGKKRSRREKDRDMSSKQEYMLSQEVLSKYNLNEMKYERDRREDFMAGSERGPLAMAFILGTEELYT